MGIRRRALLFYALLFAGACADGSSPPEPTTDIRDRLAAIPGMTVQEATTELEGYRFFVLDYDQPADHARPSGRRFRQRLALLHRDPTAPTIFYGSGYFVSLAGGRTEVTRMVEGNQLSIEHRFFAPSRPDPADWTKLTIGQAADDYHRVVQALRPIYTGRWLGTGGSKGGMAALFHRRFHPEDVDATIAYSAPFTYPVDAVQGPGNRYIAFLTLVGTDAACRDNLRGTQRRILAARAEMLPRMTDLATAQGTSFDAVLGRDRALEFAVEEMPFLFWQYGRQDLCAQIPDEGADPAALFSFLDRTVALLSYADADLGDFLPYYFQSAAQLGYPLDDESSFVDLLLYPGQDQALAYLPPGGVPVPTYDPTAVADVQDWVNMEGARILLLYGENDPWRAGAVTLGAAVDSLAVTVPAGNHQSRIADLTESDQALVLEALSRWSGVTARISPRGEKRARALDPDPLDDRGFRK